MVIVSWAFLVIENDSTLNPLTSKTVSRRSSIFGPQPPVNPVLRRCLLFFPLILIKTNYYLELNTITVLPVRGLIGGIWLDVRWLVPKLKATGYEYLNCMWAVDLMSLVCKQINLYQKNWIRKNNEIWICMRSSHAYEVHMLVIVHRRNKNGKINLFNILYI